MDFVALSQQCAPAVHHRTLAAIAKVESQGNPYAIGVVGGALVRQPRTKAEAIATAKALEAGGRNFSVGLGQVNRFNLPKYRLSYEDAFEPCQNLAVASQILRECFARAQSRFATQQGALRASFSCYYSGNFATGFRQDFAGQPSYVNKVVAAWHANGVPVPSPDPSTFKGASTTSSTHPQPFHEPNHQPSRQSS